MKISLNITGREYEFGKINKESKVEFAIESIHLVKNIYTPCYLDVQLSTPELIEDISNLEDKLLHQPVSLIIEDKNMPAYEYATGYRVFGISSVLKINDQKTSSVIHLKICSPDHILTLKKYSKSWTAKRLVEQVIEKEVAYQKNLFVGRLKGNVKEKNDFLNLAVELQHLRNKEVKDAKEFMQPYLVQYNESFYHFMVRTANRCGEFIYYEGGKLHIGLQTTHQVGEEYVSIEPKKLDPTQISELSYKMYASNEETGFATHNYLSDNENPDHDSYNFEGQAEEYLGTINKKDGAEGWKNEIYWDDYGPIISAFTSALSEDTLSEMIIQAGLSIGKDVARGKLAAMSMNDKYNKKYFANKFDDDQYNEKKDKLSQFTDIASIAKYTNDFYIKIRENEKKAEANAIHLKYKANSPCLSLCDIFEYRGKLYIITHIETQISNHGGLNTNTTEVDAILWDGKQVVPENAEKEQGTLPYPFLLKDNQMKTSGCQVAYVVDNDDPLKLGRLRIRYPWQTEQSDATPWLRVSSPMASDGSGINFVANKEDEVMVGYEYGNIERPYIVGSLYNSNNAPDPGNTCKHVIASPNGHTIKFSDPGNSLGVLTSLYPGAALLKTYIPGLSIMKNVEDKDKNGNVVGTHKENAISKNFVGGISMYDTYGFYEVSMSTDKRAINISSPLGKVEIDAFTGISIEAPNGNVSISGKNVSIVAGNKLELKSGANIDNQLGRIEAKNVKGFMKETAVGFGENLVETALNETVNKFIDFGLLRTLIETFIRPIGGEMLIKSYRNVKVEAGEGNAKIPDRFWTNDESENKAMSDQEAENKAKDEELVRNILTPIKALLTPISYYMNINNRERFNQEVNQYNTIYDTFETYVNLNIQDEDLRDSCKKLSLSSIFEDIKNAKDSYSKFAKAAKAINNSNLDNDGKVQAIGKSKQLYNIYIILKKEYNNSLPEKIIKDDIAFKAFKMLTTNEQEQLIPKYSIGEDVPLIPGIKLRRKAVYTVLLMLINKHIIMIDDEKQAKIGITNMNEAFESPLKWKEFLDCVQKYEKPKLEKGLLGKAGDLVAEHIIKSTKFKGFKDSFDLWKRNYNSGEILFSDKNGKQTLRFENGSIVTNHSNDPLEEVRTILGNC